MNIRSIAFHSSLANYHKELPLQQQQPKQMIKYLPGDIYTVWLFSLIISEKW